MPSVLPRRPDVSSDNDVLPERHFGAELAASGLVRLCAGGFVAYCSYAICRTPLLPLFARDLGAGPALIGLVMGASTLTGIVLKLPAGAWSDILGRRPLLVCGALVFATLPFTYLGVSTLAALIMLRFVHGSATAIFGPVASASLSDIAPPLKRGTWLSAYSTAQGAGQALGPVLAGYLIAAGRFDLAFLAAGAIGLAAPVIVLGWRSGSTAPASTDRWQGFKAGIGEVGSGRSSVDDCRWLDRMQRRGPGDVQGHGPFGTVGSGARVRRRSGHHDGRNERVHHGCYPSSALWGRPRRIRHYL